MTPRNKNIKGQSLVEAIGAVAVILVGIVTTVAMFIYGINALSIASLKNQAHFLAIEQIEAARWLRDSNWLKQEGGEAVLDDFHYVTDNQYGFLWTRPYTPTSRYHYRFYWRPSIDSGNCIDPDGSHLCKKVYKLDNYLFQNVISTLNPVTPTIFNRYAEFYRICAGDIIVTASGQDCSSQPGSPEQIGTQVKSIVQFSKGTQNIEYVLEERLYDWKY